MSKKESSKQQPQANPGRRRYTKEFKQEAVQMLLDGHTEAPHGNTTGRVYNNKRELF